ncbi:DUF6221 family protein [Streptomyces sp. BPPL-273]|uniref:DUF6221 family protein n=1 Tax=Streptomyces sp. BPPL-273 TaxID=2987533 RepID=UPI0024AFB347|nr:DUF6221 family protein [Streptomyces sp. BPPL-273]WHM30162.1 DUF6221 family protein [Streptomyces sp. BPPL-273]
MEDLVEFLRARLDEDEADAAAASPGPWHVDAEGDEVLAVDDITVADGFALSGRQLRATTAHIARHDPDRIMRQTAILRGRVDLWSKMAGSHARANLREFAAIWDDHPDYRPEWRL